MTSPWPDAQHHNFTFRGHQEQKACLLTMAEVLADAMAACVLHGTNKSRHETVLLHFNPVPCGMQGQKRGFFTGQMADPAFAGQGFNRQGPVCIRCPQGQF